MGHPSLAQPLLYNVSMPESGSTQEKSPPILMISNRTLPWLEEPQRVDLVKWKNGYLGSCIEPESKLAEIAGRLNERENDVANRLLLQMSEAYFNKQYSHKMHDIDRSKCDYPVISLIDARLRVYAVDLTSITRTPTLVKIGLCRKIDQDLLLAEITDGGRANIR